MLSFLLCHSRHCQYIGRSIGTSQLFAKKPQHCLSFISIFLPLPPLCLRKGKHPGGTSGFKRNSVGRG